MMKRLKKCWRQHQLRRRLKKMENALLLHLTPMQRALVLDPQPPRGLERWPRRAGKTTCACLHLLLHAPLTARYSRDEAMQLLADPDARISATMNRVIYDQLYHMSNKLYIAGIQTCVLLPPMPGVPPGFCGHVRCIDGKKGGSGSVGVYANRG